MRNLYQITPVFYTIWFSHRVEGHIWLVVAFEKEQDVHKAPPINPLLSSLSASQSLPKLIPKKHSKHSSMLPETVVLMPLESLPLMPY